MQGCREALQPLSSRIIKVHKSIKMVLCGIPVNKRRDLIIRYSPMQMTPLTSGWAVATGLPKDFHTQFTPSSPFPKMASILFIYVYLFYNIFILPFPWGARGRSQQVKIHQTLYKTEHEKLLKRLPVF
uniref:Uncharacterized protein n=1 Tax=Sphaerodactylus townsendi TaxID=933632 RepID=A0ACB8G7W1_9SAUR